MQGLTALRQYRESQGLSQEQLADRIGVTAMTISRWENGWRDPRRSSRNRISEVTGIPVQKLVQQPEAAE